MVVSQSCFEEDVRTPVVLNRPAEDCIFVVSIVEVKSEEERK